jgi:tetratricopeptide (TPR) repeat protein
VLDMLESKPEFIKQSPAHLELHARALFCLGRKDEAFAEARQSYKMRVDLINQGKGKASDISPWFLLLKDLFTTEQAADAEKFVLELCDNKPGVFELRALAVIWQLSSGKNNSHAIELQRQAIALCPPSEKGMLVDLNSMLADYLLIGGSMQEASVAYQEVIKLDPQHVSAMNNLAFLLAEELKQPDKAVPYARRAAEIAPTSGAILDTYGWVLYLNNQNDEAIKVLQDSVGFERSAGTYLHLATALAKKGDFSAASKALDDAAKYNPDPNTRQKIDLLADDIEKRQGSGG